MNNVKLWKGKLEDGKRVLCVNTPYLPEFVPRAKKLGGYWSGSEWIFDPRNENRVREALIDKFGCDDNPCDLVTVQVTFDKGAVSEERKPITAWGRILASARGRDTGARLGPGVIILQGGITSGGTHNYWKTFIKEKTIFEIKDVPALFFKDEDGNLTMEGDCWKITDVQPYKAVEVSS